MLSLIHFKLIVLLVRSTKKSQKSFREVVGNSSSYYVTMILHESYKYANKSSLFSFCEISAFCIQKSAKSKSSYILFRLFRGSNIHWTYINDWCVICKLKATFNWISIFPRFKIGANSNSLKMHYQKMLYKMYLVGNNNLLLSDN